jgi:hypothetical protein
MATSALLAAALLGASAAIAQAPQDLRDLIGAKSISGEAALRGRGFAFIDGSKGNNAAYAEWWNAGASRCIRVTTVADRFDAIIAAQPSDCGKTAGGPFGPPGGGPGGFRPGNGFGNGGFDPNSLKSLTVDAAKDRLRTAGFASARSIKQNNQQWDLWQKFGRDDQCVGFTSYKGRITETDRFATRECTDGRDPTFRVRTVEGLRVNDAKNRLRAAGFAPARNITRDKQQWDLWESTGRGDKTCVGFTSYKGMVTATDSFRDRDCE